MESIQFANIFPLRKIVSGGQTGVDRAALDAAIFLELEHGGWCPLGRRAEDGRIDSIYNLQETSERDYVVRTEQNVIDSDGTLVLYSGAVTGGTLLTVNLAKRHGRSLLLVDLNRSDDSNRIHDFLQWIQDSNIHVLNVAGPRESSCPGISNRAGDFLVESLR